MPTLSRELRKELERTVKLARLAAEDGARKAIDRLGVGEAEAPSGLKPAAKSLRNKLRAHGRQLGDKRNDRTKKQETKHLVEECAYEHWHRLLFARFLAVNDLLIEPQSGMAITLAECQELAREQNEDWLRLASSFAQRMLPQIFRPDDPVLSVDLPPETRSKLEDYLKGLSPETFIADDSLGWVYQFWQADRKDEVNASEVKIGADELPAVTQLFTEDYMVLFLLQNTLGAWWTGRKASGGQVMVGSEAEARRAVALPGIDWEYLRFVRDGEGPWRPAAGTFNGWPKSAKAIKLLDPCMGSGHFLVFALPILVAMRMAEEKLSKADAVFAVLRDNIFGLEIDLRCTQIAAFNLALAAWKLAGYCELPALHLACSGLGPSASEEEWLKLADRRGMDRRTKILAGDLIRDNLRHLHQTFSQAPTLGSLIDPNQQQEGAYSVDFATLRPYLEAAMTAEKADDDANEQAVAAQGMVKAAELLAGEYTLVITNVPYLGHGKQDDVLKAHLKEYFAEGKADLSTAFVLRCLEFCAKGASCALVTPQNWLFLSSYKKLRELLLKQWTWNGIAILGEEAWWTFGLRGPQTLLSIFSEPLPDSSNCMFGLDVSTRAGEQVIVLEKKIALLSGESQSKPSLFSQAEQLNNPSASISLGDMTRGMTLGEIGDICYGLKPGQVTRVTFNFWEMELRPGSYWMRMVSTPSGDSFYSGRTEVCMSIDEVNRQSVAGFGVRGEKAWGRSGVVYSKMRNLSHSLYLGEIFDANTNVIVPFKKENVAPVLEFVSSGEFRKRIRSFNSKLDITCELVEQIPIDLAHWQQVAAEKYPKGLPEPESDDPTQWLFHGRPEHSTAPLQVAVARLLGYRWPAELDSEMRLSKRARGLVKRCDNLLAHADDDGIVCLTPIKGEASAADRLNKLLSDAYGSEWSAGNLDGLLREAGFAGKTLDVWLRNGFFENHCAIFHNRPFIWHIWDGLPNGFHALVNYHRLAGPDGEGRRTLEKLIFTYLGDWIDQQRRDQSTGAEGADARVAAAVHLRAELQKILAGEPPYDIFVRWKPLHEQPIGWEPDTNDGVRLNIRPFMTAKPLGASKNRCIFRVTPKSIKWDCDRGKEPERDKADFPWFWSWDEATADFQGLGSKPDGKRWNGLHYTTEFKKKAQKRAGSESKNKERS